MKTTGVVVYRFFAVLLCFLTGGLSGFAAPTRIRQPIDESSRVVLAGNVHPLAKGQYDRGPVDPSLAAGRMLLVLKRSAAQEAELHQFLDDLQDKNSPKFHKWLTPAQFGERFGVSAADAQTLSNWLEGHGLTIAKVSAGMTSIEFSGTAGQMQQAFHTSIHRYAIGGEEHLANATDPEIPAALEPVVAGIVGLNDFFLKTVRTPAVHGAYDRVTHTARAQFTTAAGSNLLYVGPADAAAIYDTPNSLNANFKGGPSYTGSGETIAVVSDANINTSDVDTYRSFFGLPPSTPRVIIDGNDPGVDASTSGHTQQALLDLEVAGALAPHAKLILYTARDTTLVSGLFLAVSRAIDDNLSDIVQFGFSSCELDQGYSGNQFISYQWEQAAADGVTVVSAAGDSGSAGCDIPANDSAASHGLAVNAFASTANNIAVGGTDFDALPGNFSGYVGSNGIAVGYIPELPWNNSVDLGENGTLSANLPFKDASGFTNDFAGGGGASSCGSFDSATSPDCRGYAKPSWQIAAGSLNIPDDGVRDLPDVALLAGTGQYGATWAVCGNDYDASGNPIADCSPGSGSSNIQGIGGTSAAASAFAGILALVGQSQASASKTTRLGQANFVLYNLANQAALYGSVFHDIASGNDAVVCLSGSTNCASNDFLTGYNAGAKFDQATGLGSADASALVANWSKAVFTPTTVSYTLNGGTSPISVAHGTPIDIHVSVAGSGGIPTGTVAIQATVDEENASYGDDVGLAGPLSNGILNAQVDDEPGGTYNTWASYGGDLNFSASTSIATPVVLIVSPEPSTVSMSLFYRNASGTHQSTAPDPIFTYGTYVSVDALPYGRSKIGIATGTVTFEDNGQTLATRTDNLNQRGFAEIPTYYWTVGAHSIAATYSGDNSFNPSGATGPLKFTIGQAASALTVMATPSSLASGTVTITGTVTAATPNGGVPPSGSVNIVDSTNGAPFGSATLLAGQGKSTFTLTIQATQLTLGTNTLTATYAGDTNYTGSSGTATVTRLTIAATTLTVVANPSSLITGTATVTGQITPASSAASAPPTGSITLVDSTNGSPLGTAPLVAGTGMNGLAIATFTLQVNATSLALGANTLSATYAGDANYAGCSGSTTLTLLAPPTPPQFTVSASAVNISTPGQTSGNTSTITVTPENGFTGQVNLTAALVSSPPNALSPATLTFSAASVTITGTASATDIATIATTALTYAMERQEEHAPGRWFEAGGVTLAGLLLLGIPARRRGWRTMLGLFLFAAAGLSLGCGVHLNPLKTAATSPGTYVFSVNGVDQATGLLKAQGSITVNVQ